MSVPSICPLCSGSGKLPTNTDSTVPGEKTCHACDGHGIVWPPVSIVSQSVFPPVGSKPIEWELRCGSDSTNTDPDLKVIAT